MERYGGPTKSTKKQTFLGGMTPQMPWNQGTNSVQLRWIAGSSNGRRKSRRYAGDSSAMVMRCWFNFQKKTCDNANKNEIKRCLTFFSKIFESMGKEDESKSIFSTEDMKYSRFTSVSVSVDSFTRERPPALELPEPFEGAQSLPPFSLTSGPCVQN